MTNVKKILMLVTLLVLWVLWGTGSLVINFINNKEAGDIESAESIMKREMKVDISNIELVSHVIVPEKEDQFVLDIDGATIYEGKVKIIPEHEIKHFRAYSEDLESYVFATYNSNKGRYSYINNYKVKSEKENALKIKEKVLRTMNENNVKVKKIHFNKFSNNNKDLDEVYKIPKDLHDYSLIGYTNYLRIVINLESPLKDLERVKDLIYEDVNSVEDYIPVDIITSDEFETVFIYNMKPLISVTESGGLMQEF